MPFDKLTSQRLTRHEKFCLRRLSDLSFIKLIGIHDGFENVTVLFFEIVSGNVVFLQISQQGLFLVLMTRQTFDNYRRFPNYSFILLNCIRKRFLLNGFLFYSSKLYRETLSSLKSVVGKFILYERAES